MRLRDIAAAVKRHKGAVAVAVAIGLLVVFPLAGLGWKLYQRHRATLAQSDTVVPTTYWVIGPFGPELQRAYEPELHPDPARSCKGADGAVLRWKELPVVEGVQCLDFRKLFKKDNASGYALTYISSPEDQAGALLLGSDDTIKVWVNGEPVHEYTRFRIGKPDEDRAEVRWKRGRNTVLVKVVNVSGDHLFFLKCVGATGLVATTKLAD